MYKEILDLQSGEFLLLFDSWSNTLYYTLVIDLNFPSEDYWAQVRRSRRTRPIERLPEHNVIVLRLYSFLHKSVGTVGVFDNCGVLSDGKFARLFSTDIHYNSFGV